MVKGNVTTYDGNGMLAQRLHGNRPFAKDFVHHHGNGSIPRHVAGCAKAIHRNIKGDDERLLLGTKAQHGGQRSQCGHHGTTGDARTGHHANGQQQHEIEEEWETVGKAIHQANGERTGRDLHHGTRHVNRSAQRDGEAGYALVYPILERSSREWWLPKTMCLRP